MFGVHEYIERPGWLDGDSQAEFSESPDHVLSSLVVRPLHVRHIVRSLLKGAHTLENVADGGGWTPLLWAARNDHKGVAKILLARGADINARTLPGWTPLYTSIFHQHKDMAVLLIAHGADPNLREVGGGPTPL